MFNRIKDVVSCVKANKRLRNDYEALKVSYDNAIIEIDELKEANKKEIEGLQAEQLDVVTRLGEAYNVEKSNAQEREKEVEAAKTEIDKLQTKILHITEQYNVIYDNAYPKLDQWRIYKLAGENISADSFFRVINALPSSSDLHRRVYKVEFASGLTALIEIRADEIDWRCPIITEEQYFVISRLINPNRGLQVKANMEEFFLISDRLSAIRKKQSRFKKEILILPAGHNVKELVSSIHPENTPYSFAFNDGEFLKLAKKLIDAYIDDYESRSLNDTDKSKNEAKKQTKKKKK